MTRLWITPASLAAQTHGRWGATKAQARAAISNIGRLTGDPLCASQPHLNRRLKMISFSGSTHPCGTLGNTTACADDETISVETANA